MKRFLLAILTLVWLTATPNYPAWQSSRPGTLRGMVVRDGTPGPIRNANIVVGADAASLKTLQSSISGLEDDYPLIRKTLMATPSPPSSEQSFRTLTDAEGRFSVEGIPPGKYSIVVLRDGYYGIASDGRPNLLASGEAVINSGQTTNVTFSMIEGSGVSGRILGINGMPAPSMTVWLSRITYDGTTKILKSAGYRESNDRGDYRFYDVPPDEYVLLVTPFCFSNNAPRPSASCFPAGTNVTPLQMAARTYFPSALEPAKAAPFVLRSGDELKGYDLQVRTTLSAKLSGRVVSALPVIGGDSDSGLITLIPHDRSPVVFADSWGATLEMKAPANGAFEFANIPSGTYDIFASLPHPNGYGTAPVYETVAYGRASVTANGANATGITITIREGVEVRGRVLLDGRGLAGVRVSLQPIDSAAGIREYVQVGRESVTTRGDGTFSVPFISPALYRVRVTAPEAEAFVQDIQQAGVSVYDSGIVVGTNAPASIQVLMNAEGGMLLGTVSGQAVGGTLVTLIPDDRRQNLGLYKTASTDPLGGFDMSGIRPGRYKLFAWQGIPENAYQNSDFIKRYEDLGTPVVISVGARITKTIPLIPVSSR